jgi:GntR family transcriptional regulator, transcriptional repressor for pyruvate dehydrogenase complex
MFERIRKRLAADEIETRLKRDILNGTLKAGDTLPPERELAETFGVNRLTLRQGLSRLSAQGLLTIRQGDGIYVNDFTKDGGFDVFGELFAAVRTSKRGKVVLGDLLELRRTIAGEAAALAAKRRTESDVDELERKIDHLVTKLDAGANRREVDRAEMDISRTIVKATGNLAFRLVLNTVFRFIERFPEIVDLAPMNAAKMTKQYRELLGAIAKRDANKARSTVVDAMTEVEEAMLEGMKRR